MEYGLIGEKLGHSFSKEIHNLIGNYNYELKEIPRENLDFFMKNKDFKGINVTIPYKQSVIPYLDEIDDAAKQIGAVNTIVNKNGKLFGYNTDFYGMKSLFEKINLEISGKNVLILGTGGTSKTAAALAKSGGAKSVCKVSRCAEEKNAENPENEIPVISYEKAVEKTETNIIINTTPCGMFPKTDNSPILLEKFENLEGVVDAIYNPNCTNFVLEAKSRNLKAEGGLFMLVMQAIKTAEYFFEKPIENSRATEIFCEILGRKENIVLIGMPSCGKTTVGKLISKYTGKTLIDCDEEIIKKEKSQITKIFAENGEEYFRNVEAQIIKEISLKTGCIISTGGGAVLKSENVKNLRKNGRIFFINRPLQNLLPTSDRPTANSAEKIAKLFEIRRPIYEKAADEIINANQSAENVAKEIIKKMSAKIADNFNFAADENISTAKDIAFFLPSKANGSVNAPPSKSLAHRIMICAAFAQGESFVSNVDFSEDILATLDCIKNFGAEVQIFEDSVKICGCGTNFAFKNEAAPVFNCRESGSTLRFFIPAAILFSKTAQKITFAGSRVLMTRPLSVYEDLCKKLNVSFERKTAENGGKIEICRNSDGEFGFNSGKFEIPGGISSQFITGFLFVLPLLKGDSEIKLIPPVESRSYINLTIQALREFGVNAEWKDGETLFVKGGQTYKPRQISVEGDFSNAAFLDAFNYFGGNVNVLGLNEKSLQGDKIYKTMFEQLKNGAPTLNISDCPDLAPILFVTAAAHNGATFTGTRRLALKESDRGKIMCEQIAEFGIKTEYCENQITIKKGKLNAPNKILQGCNDHRIVMAFSTLLAATGGKINDAHAVKKSFPGYFEEISKLGIKVKIL